VHLDFFKFPPLILLHLGLLPLDLLQIGLSLLGMLSLDLLRWEFLH